MQLVVPIPHFSKTTNNEQQTTQKQHTTTNNKHQTTSNNQHTPRNNTLRGCCADSDRNDDAFDNRDHKYH